MIYGQIDDKSLQWAKWRKYMNISEPNHKKTKDGRKDKMITIDKDGSLRTAE